MKKYSITKHNQLSELKGKDIYVLWKESKTKYGNGIKGIFQGTKKECEEKLKEIKGDK
jgi:cytoplasmic iron level regulating protein YaaA (DUF328/UPF0246 family)